MKKIVLILLACGGLLTSCQSFADWLLEDYDHMMTVGCAFGADMEPIMMAGYAKFLD